METKYAKYRTTNWVFDGFSFVFASTILAAINIFPGVADRHAQKIITAAAGKTQETRKSKGPLINFSGIFYKS